MKIAIVGAQGTGKTRLADALRIALQSDTDADTVAECLATESWVLDSHRSYDLTLLMGLDLTPQDQAQDSLATQHDAQLRQLLNQHAIAYAVVYGTGPARTDCALQAIAYHRQRSAKRSSQAAPTWHWNCETCSDADCEHRLFTALVEQRDSEHF